MLEKQLVSIIVPVYNGETYLGDCIESILKQTYKNIEVLVVDDGSEDISFTIIKEFMKKDGRLKVISHKTNQGVSISRNDALKCIEGEFVSFVDADDVIDSRFIQELVDAIGDRDVSISAYKKIDIESERDCILDDLENDNWERLMFHVLCTNKVGGYCFNKLYRRDLLEGILFDQTLSMGEDFLFLLQYLKKCSSYRYIPKPLYGYRMNQYSATHKIGNTGKLDGRKRSYIDAVDKISVLLKNDGEWLQPYVSYRSVRGNIWVMLQLIYSGIFDKSLIKQIRNNILCNYKEYKKVKFGSSAQKMTVGFIILFPSALYMMGRVFYKLSPKRMKAIVGD